MEQISKRLMNWASILEETTRERDAANVGRVRTGSGGSGSRFARAE